jgi:hypothetical protein
MRKLIFIIVIFLFSLNILPPSQLAAAEMSTGGTIFVPAYRSFYQIYGSTRDSYALTSTAFLHNIDPKQSIEVLSIEFFDSEGKLIKNLLEAPLLIKPRNSKEITIQPRTQPEDCAAHLSVHWKSSHPANTPLVEVLMVGQVLNRGISFLTQGYEVKK